MRCGYDLSGLSITRACPECGLAIKATLLAVVDPKAEALAPLIRPRLTAWSLVLWSLGGVLLVIAGWAARVRDFTAMASGTSAWASVHDGLAIAGLCALVIGAPGLIGPVRRAPRRELISGAIGLLCIAAGAALAVYVHVRIDHHLLPYIEPAPVRRTALHVGAVVLGGIGLLGVRPTLRRLAERSWVMRHGRVQRQPLLALAGALGVVAAGDALSLLAGQSGGWVAGWLEVGHTVLVALGSVLFSVGVVNLFRDAVRLRPVLASRPIGLEGVMDEERPRRPGGAEVSA